jgi:hypothetical protein
MTTPRRHAAPPSAPTPSPAVAASAQLTPPERVLVKGDKGDPGAMGPSGPSVFLEISESGSTELYGTHPHGFAAITSGGAPIQCWFRDWQPGDILQVDFWVQLAFVEGTTGRLIVQAQISTNGGSEWHGLSGARAQLGTELGASASSSVELAAPEGSSPPLVRLHVSHSYQGTLDYGPGPEGATLLLRCTRWAAKTYSATGRLTPPRT